MKKKVLLTTDDHSREDKNTLLLQEDQFKLISDWYHSAILAMTRLKTVQSDPRWLARQLGISPEETHQAMQRLERLGIIETKPLLKQICDPIEVVSDIPSKAIQKYHKQNLNLAAEKIDTVPNHLREFQSISLALTAGQIKVLKKMIDQFLEQAAEVEVNNKNQIIYNLNVQLFPISKINEEFLKENK